MKENAVWLIALNLPILGTNNSIAFFYDRKKKRKGKTNRSVLVMVRGIDRKSGENMLRFSVKRMEVIIMHIKTLVCDLDGTLLAPGGGIHLSDAVADALISLQKKGLLLF